MLMNLENLIGETTEYEKKQSLEIKKPKSWCKSVSAFANSSGTGGTLIFGISDDDQIIGLKDAKRDAEIISEQIKERLNPIPEFNLKFYNTNDGKILLVLDVFAGEQTPYYYDAGGALTAYQRIGNQSVPVSSVKLKELILKGSSNSFDSLQSKFNFDEMSFTKLKSTYKQRTGNSFEESDFVSFGILNDIGKLTNAGALLADDSPVRHSRVFCTRWNGFDKAPGIIDAVDDKEFSGDLINLLQNSLDFVLNNSKKSWMKTSNGRIEMPEYPERAVLEGIVNALIHRNYLEIGSEVHIDMFIDRLEIYSPGGMYDGTKVQDRDIMTFHQNVEIPSSQISSIVSNLWIAEVVASKKFLKNI